MATRPRKRSASGFYHVFQRGVNCFDIFEDDDDRSFFIDTMGSCAEKYGVEIHAWCLMSNHVHMLVRASCEKLSAMMRRLGSMYARFFNARHKRSGALFGSRFSSVCVETDPQLLAVVRYIHRNPIEHDERTLCGEYPWSSYSEYIAGAPLTCKIDFVLDLFGGLTEFVRFHEEERDFEHHLDIGTVGPMRDEEARARANALLGAYGFSVSVSDVGTLPRDARDKAISLVRYVIGCSYRQLQRLTAVAYSAIRNAVSTADWVESEPLPSLQGGFGFAIMHPCCTRVRT